jgi:hypothetical protein
MNNDQLYFYNRGFNDGLAKNIDAHPAKTLTELSGVEIIGMSGKYDFNYEVDIIDFARAIIKKASE